jgi:uncharacterized membrane protein YfcA
MRRVRHGALKVAVTLTLPALVAAGVYAGLVLGHRVDQAALGAVVGVIAYMAVVHLLARLVPRRRAARRRRRAASVG